MMLIVVGVHQTFIILVTVQINAKLPRHVTDKNNSAMGKIKAKIFAKVTLTPAFILKSPSKLIFFSENPHQKGVE